MKKRLLGILLSFALMLTMMPVLGISTPTYADDAPHTHDSITFQEWTSSNSLPSLGGSYYLTNNVTLSSSWDVTENISLCLNGHTITGPGDLESYVIHINTGTLNLYDCNSDFPGHITGGGNGVYIDGESSKFNMYGGVINDNSASYGGGVLNYGTFTMNGGTITGNNADELGGGVRNSRTFNMYGGVISNNTALEEGGGIYNSGMINLSGKPTITGNTVNNVADNVYLTTRGEKITITDILTTGASVGVKMEQVGVFTRSTSPIKASDYKGCFSSDDSTYSVMTTEDNELKLSAHEHSFTYTASGDTITATCSDSSCPLHDTPATLTIAAPKHTTYGDGNDAAAQITDANSIQGDAKVQYQKKTGESTYDTATETAPTNAGTYKASITLGTGDNSATAHVVYDIAKATPTISTNPTASAITYGQTLENSTLSGGTAKLGDNTVAGTFAWETKTTAPAVSDSQKTEYDVVFTPNDSDNYNTAECKVKLTVNPKEVGLEWTNTQLTYNGQQQAPTATATELVSGDAGQVSVTVTGGQTDASTTAYTATASELNGDKAGNYKLPDANTTTFTISPRPITGATVTLSATSLPYTGSSQTVTVSGVKLGETDLSTSDYDVSGQTSGTDIGTYAVTVVGKGNYKASATAQWSITQATPSIDPAPTASDITYGQTLSDSKLTGGKAKVGDTEISGTFSWKNGSTKPSVADSGETEYTVVFTPTDTTKYKPAEAKVKLTVNKGEPTAAAVTANNRKYDGTKKPLVTADESILVGGTMQYALGSDDKTAPDKGWGESIPEAAEKGTYYVWYMVKGDANHNDSEPQSVTVTISEKGPEPVDESTITFDLNGGTLNGKTGKVAVKVNNGIGITLPEPTRDGYTFDYWEGSKYYAGDQYTVNGDHTFKAVWKTGAGGNGKGGSSKKGVNTGDENTLGAWIVLLVAALAGTTGMVFARKRRND